MVAVHKGVGAARLTLPRASSRRVANSSSAAWALLMSSSNLESFAQNLLHATQVWGVVEVVVATVMLVVVSGWSSQQDCKYWYRYML